MTFCFHCLHFKEVLMRIYAQRFIYDNISCENYYLEICDFESGNGLIKTSGGSAVEIKSAKPLGNDRWLNYDNQYNEPLKFTIHVMKTDHQPIPLMDQSFIGEWLLRRDTTYRPFQFDCPEYGDILFYAKVESINEISIGGVVYGIEINFVTNAPYGFSPVLHKTWQVTSPSQTFTFLNSSEEVGYLYPNMKITINEDCDFSITNNKDNKPFKINGCKAGEIITIDGQYRVYPVTTLDTHDLSKSFNYHWFRFVKNFNDNTNKITVNGKAIIELDYQFIRKVGVS